MFMAIFNSYVNCLVVLTILQNMSSSIGRNPIYEMENKSHVWNHQPENHTQNEIHDFYGNFQ